MNRKELDLKLLFTDLRDNPQDPRIYYYIAQTFYLLERYEEAFRYFIKRGEMNSNGFIQEMFDAVFEAARIAEFHLKHPWSECEALYLRAHRIDNERPEPLYFLGIHHFMSGSRARAFTYLRDAFRIGYPAHRQYSLRPIVSHHFVPKYLARLCYEMDDYVSGRDACDLYLEKNSADADGYQEIVSWKRIYDQLMNLQVYRESGKKVSCPARPVLCIHADGGFHPWIGSDIEEKGVGGSETWVIEMARHIRSTGLFDVIVFCNTPERQERECHGVMYRHLDSFYEFVATNYIHTCIISRFSEYLPVAFQGFTENVYLVLHDLTPSGIVIPLDKKLKRVFCLTDWHVEHLATIFPSLRQITTSLYYGIDPIFVSGTKQLYSFIYSSFPNRGLLELLEIWPRIYEIQPLATLHIYSDVNHAWACSVAPEKMARIRELLRNCAEMGVNYHGWVSKAELASAWRTAHIWFYPCTFMETFCLTALEAARSRTLVVSNHLAALRETVGDRGIIIDGDPTTAGWKEEAVARLVPILTSPGFTHESLVEKNYQWAQSLSWENQSGLLIKELMLQRLEYKGMYNWTNDLPGGSRRVFLERLEEFVGRYRRCLHGEVVRVMEVGVYTGVSLIGLLQAIPNSIGLGVDPWKNYPENHLLRHVEDLDVERSFHRNIAVSGMNGRVYYRKGDSTTVLLDLVEERQMFDVIYVDGSHLLLDCFADLILCDRLLTPDALLIIDDVLYKKEEILDSPFEAVRHFLQTRPDQYDILEQGYRVFLRKKC